MRAVRVFVTFYLIGVAIKARAAYGSSFKYLKISIKDGGLLGNHELGTCLILLKVKKWHLAQKCRSGYNKMNLTRALL